MSLLLEQEARKDPQRSRDLDATDAQMGFSEAELLAGDLERMQRKQERFRQTLSVVHEMELTYFRSVGWL